MNSPRGFSLLWPANSVRRSGKSDIRIGENCIRDLDLPRTINELCWDKRLRRDIEDILLHFCGDPQVIRYRQDILEDLLTHQNLVTRFKKLFPILYELVYSRYREAKERTTLFEVTWRINELANLIECVEGLSDIFQDIGEEVRSEGLRVLRDEIAAIERDETYQHLVQELPELQAKLNSTQSVTIGVNLDHRFHPVAATLLAVNKETFASASLLNRLFGKNIDEMQGIASLHSVPKDMISGRHQVKPMMMPLFRDLARILEKVCQPIAKALKRYISINSRALSNLGQELGFYLGAVDLITTITKCGLPMCKPELVPQEERVCEIEEVYNLNLALHLISEGHHRNLRDVVVTNDVIFGPQGRILILTGPNRGGKTTYIQAVGLTQILAQAGLYVPGKQVRISPVDTIYTHFPVEEQFEKGTGRFGDEAKRFYDIFAHATRNSLILLNESLSSTSHSECLYLAQDIMRILRLTGIRAIFATHLHELAAQVDILNAETPGDSKIISLVASRISEEAMTGEASEGELIRSYKIVPGPPLGRSYATELARQYGVSFEQLRTMLSKRGILH